MRTCLTILLLATVARAEDKPATQLTVYNAGFATVRETRTFDLAKGPNDVRFTGVTSALEADSVVLRDLKAPDALRILEQNYEANPLSVQHMLEASEGKMLDFEVVDPSTSTRRVVKAKLVRAPATPSRASWDAPAPVGAEAIVELDGRLSFQLPGRPLFEALDAQAFLKPTLLWKLDAATAGKHEAEIAYITGGLQWDASYSFIAGKGDTYDVFGQITLQNASGKDFENARVKVVAGDVARVRTSNAYQDGEGQYALARARTVAVEERSFDEYHLYELPRPTSVRDRETKQVEFLHATQVPATRVFAFDGEGRADRYGRLPSGENTKVRVELEFSNTAGKGLGIALPRGRARVYRRDTDGREEFVGEDLLDHTPQGEPFRVAIGYAFDLVGERKVTDYDRVSEHLDRSSIAIVVRNHKKEAVEVRIVEHAPSHRAWKVTAKSAEFTKLDADTFEFRVRIPADGEANVTYTLETKP